MYDSHNPSSPAISISNESTLLSVEMLSVVHFSYSVKIDAVSLSCVQLVSDVLVKSVAVVTGEHVLAESARILSSCHPDVVFEC